MVSRKPAPKAQETRLAHTLGVAHEEAFSKAEANRAAEYAKLCNDLEAITKTFESMELQAPVAYWRTRRCSIGRLSIWTLAVLIIFSLLSVTLYTYFMKGPPLILPTDSTAVPYAALFAPAPSRYS